MGCVYCSGLFLGLTALFSHLSLSPFTFPFLFSHLSLAWSQVTASPSELAAAGSLALSCALSGRYLRDLRLAARHASLTDQPPELPPALPLAEPLSLLVRLSRMQVGGLPRREAVTWRRGSVPRDAFLSVKASSKGRRCV
jgi:hypothetical protein